MSEKLEKTKKEAEIIRTYVNLFIGPGSDSNKDYCENRPEVPGNDHSTKKNGDRFEKTIADIVHTIQNAI
jgi:hypothetical protein